ncbi:PQQ-binding-like beta-propeller repeat protein [Natrialba sp. PRR66]|uniref:outer membrane protein assembly factor BamB family protein n=1 Tax=Natrialba sp. PRR66 TaxID=3098146 RepID=UPI002B1D4FB6|nr:PQQ-binding-like beta-propeller repeat protein [Natrialba sp. PRR66]
MSVAALSIGAGCTSSVGGDAGESESDGADAGTGDGGEPEHAGTDVPTDDWPSFQRTPGNSGYILSSAPTADPDERWSTTLSGALEAQVAVVEGTVYASTADGTVHALEAASGDELWAESLAGSCSHCPCVADGFVVVGTDAGELVALSAADGDREWEIDLAGPAAGPTAAHGVVYVGTSGVPVASAVDVTDGTERWTTELASPAVDYPAVDGDSVYVGVEEGLDGGLHAFDPADGDERWLHEGDRMRSPTIAGGAVVAPSLTISVLTHAGRPRAGFGFAGHIRSSPAVTSDAIVVGSTGGQVAAAKRGDVGVYWSVEVGQRPISAPAITDESVYLTAGGPELVALDTGTGELRWTRSLAGELATGPAVADGAVFVGTDEGRLVAFE